LPPDFDGAEVFEQFHAPPFGGRLVVLAVVEACDPDACTRAHGICVTETGEIVLISGEDGLWGLSGGGKEVGETTAETFAREVWEEACSRVVESHFLFAVRFVELDEHGSVHHGGLHAKMWARVELEEWNPQFEMTRRRLVSPDEAVDICLFSNVTRLMMASAAHHDPMLVWDSE
jgi:8-oxo-dGTP pyrophosphatase MutT (NUDIX family)